MIIKEIKGYELEKELPNTSEDFFNRSIVTYEMDGEEFTLHLLYVRFYEEKMNELTPFKENPIFSIENRDYQLADVVALNALLQVKDNLKRKRVYINEEEQFKKLFSKANVEQLKEIATAIHNNGSYTVK
jgi:hypothetical protein